MKRKELTIGTNLSGFQIMKAKPLHVRKRIALFSTFAVFFLIVSVWWINLGSTASDSQSDNLTIKEAFTPVDALIHSFSLIKESTVNGYAKIEGDLQNLVSSTTLVASVENAQKDTRKNISKKEGGDVVYPDQLWDKKTPESIEE